MQVPPPHAQVLEGLQGLEANGRVEIRQKFGTGEFYL